MAKEQLVEIVKKLLETESNLDFLTKLSNSEIGALVAAMRARIEHPGKFWTRLMHANQSLKQHLIGFLIGHQIFNFLTSTNSPVFISNSLILI